MVITYAHHAQIGRVHRSRVSGDIFYDRSAPEPREVLTTILEATDVGAALDAYEPHSDGYLALKTELAELNWRSLSPPLVGVSRLVASPNP
ncbi:MAG: hypothetical protein WB689_19115 [Xanthobacteraceae bacterium]